jgi:purine-binding chemotaxis protein CheW
MNIVVQTDQEKVSLLVDSVGDVLELSPDAFESVPPSVRSDVRALVSGVYKLSGKVMLVLDTKSAVTL